MKGYWKRKILWITVSFTGITLLGCGTYLREEKAELKAVAAQNPIGNGSIYRDHLQTVSARSDKEAAGNIALKEEVYPDSYEIENFQILYQMPELPTGCEITALTMVLQHYGFQADKVTMAEEYLPTLFSAGVYMGADGKPYGNDMNQYFIGDPRTEGGIICGTDAIVTAANTYLENKGSSMRAEAITGISIEELYQLVSKDTPVVVWCTIGMQDRRETQGWYTQNGEYVDWSRNDHGAVLIGYSQNTVTIADPLSGRVEYDRVQFESVFISRGNQAVVVKR